MTLCNLSTGCLFLFAMTVMPAVAHGALDRNCNGIERASEKDPQSGGDCIDYVANGLTCNPSGGTPALRPCDDYQAPGRNQAATCSPYLAPDKDGDGIGDSCDNCPDIANLDQANKDGDRFGDACDNCPIPGACTESGECFCEMCFGDDKDADGIHDMCDNCPSVANKEQGDRDRDGMGDVCDDHPDVSTNPPPMSAEQAAMAPGCSAVGPLTGTAASWSAILVLLSTWALRRRTNRQQQRHALESSEK